MPFEQRYYFVYIVTNRSKTLYIGMTNSILRRIFEHKTKASEGFTSKYKLDRLVYWERYTAFIVPSLVKNKSKAGYESRKFN
jgi:putative endonuclease